MDNGERSWVCPCRLYHEAWYLFYLLKIISYVMDVQMCHVIHMTPHYFSATLFCSLQLFCVLLKKHGAHMEIWPPSCLGHLASLNYSILSYLPSCQSRHYWKFWCTCTALWHMSYQHLRSLPSFSNWLRSNRHFKVLRPPCYIKVKPLNSRSTIGALRDEIGTFVFSKQNYLERGEKSGLEMMLLTCWAGELENMQP